MPPAYPGYSPAPPRSPKSSAGMWSAIGGGALVLLIGALLAWRFTRPDQPVTPTPQPAKPAVVDKNQPAPQPAPAPAPADTKQQPAPADAKGTPMPKAALVAQGKLNFKFHAYDAFAGNQLALAGEDGENSHVMIYEFMEGKFEEAVEVLQPLGKVNDVNHGPIFNDGKDYAVIPAEQGLVVVPEDGDADQYTGKNIQHALVGDFDGDKQYETLVVGKDGNFFMLNLFRYAAGGQGPKLKSVGAQAWPDGTQVVNLAGVNRALLAAIDPTPVQGKMPIALYGVDANLTLPQFASLAVHNNGDVTGFAAGNIGGKPTLVVAYNGSPAYLEFFEINTAKPNTDPAVSPASRGKLTLPAGSGYQVILGSFTKKGAQEVLVLLGDGSYSIYGF
jgi:hypothetical protein